MTIDQVGALDAASSPDNIGPTIDELRRRCKLTVVGLSRLSGIKRSTLTNRIAGRDITVDDIKRLAQVFVVPYVVLFLEPDQAVRWVLDHPAPRPCSVNGDTAAYLSSAA